MISASQRAAIRKRLEETFFGARVVLHHVPKCGGTSVSQALRARYRLSHANIGNPPVYNTISLLLPHASVDAVESECDSFKERSLIFLMHKKIHFINGHVYFSNTAYDAFEDIYKFITMLRDPVALYISSFFHYLNTPDNRWQLCDSIEEFLTMPRAKMFGSVYVDYFSGARPGDNLSERTKIERAKENLRKFSAIGFTEDMASFESRLRKVLGVRIRIGHLNKSKVESSERDRMITPGVRRKIEDLSAPNIEIYDFAKRLSAE